MALANSGGKEAGAGGGSTAKLEAFTVNLSSTERYLQLSMALQIANAEVSDRIKMFMPKLRHALIVLLSSKDSEQLQSLEGKHQLMEEIKEGVNKTLNLKEHDGVTDVFFENFVIQ
jgi:flagellar FliL protein